LADPQRTQDANEVEVVCTTRYHQERDPNNGCWWRWHTSSNARLEGEEEAAGTPSSNATRKREEDGASAPSSRRMRHILIERDRATTHGHRTRDTNNGWRWWLPQYTPIERRTRTIGAHPHRTRYANERKMRLAHPH